MKNVFQYKDYKAYLNDLIQSKPARGRGIKSDLANFISCQTSYLSSVLKGPSHFSLEQADFVNRYFGHNTEEAHFFLLLIQLARAGTKELKKYFKDQIESIRKKRLILKDQLDVKETLSREDQATYYSHWYFSAIHIILTIPKFQTKDNIASAMNLPLNKVSQILEFLLSVGLAEQVGQRYVVGKKRIHLEGDSPVISKHHSNWRMLAIRALESDNPEDLHYSSVVTVSEKDAYKIKSDLIEAIQKAKDCIKTSKEEKIFSFCLDFFEIPTR